MWWPPPGMVPPSPRRVVGALLLLRLVPFAIVGTAVGALLFISLAGTLLAACQGLDGDGRGGPLQARAVPSRQVVTVLRVKDGDTFTVRELDRPVRMIGVDTPETVDPHRPPGCYGPEASAYTKRRLPAGITVTLVYEVPADDPAGLTDRFGRRLAYVYTSDGTFLNRELVIQGYARAHYYPPNDDHRGELALAQRHAKAHRKGLWGAC
jgi:micrococcal nuclease